MTARWKTTKKASPKPNAWHRQSSIYTQIWNGNPPVPLPPSHSAASARNFPFYISFWKPCTKICTTGAPPSHSPHRPARMPPPPIAHKTHPKKQQKTKTACYVHSRIAFHNQAGSHHSSVLCTVLYLYLATERIAIIDWRTLILPLPSTSPHPCQTPTTNPPTVGRSCSCTYIYFVYLYSTDIYSIYFIIYINRGKWISKHKNERCTKRDNAATAALRDIHYMKSSVQNTYICWWSKLSLGQTKNNDFCYTYWWNESTSWSS
jgi:hypothetical protein